MSGFCGFTGEIENSNSVITSMTDKIKHRGLDYLGIYSKNAISFGFCGLSINTDTLNECEQPLCDKNGSIVIVLNGDIENSEELRAKLSGHELSNSTNAEILICLYKEYGKEMLSYIQGAFAFVIYDTNQNTVFGARDRFGVKPFYYSIIDGNILFGSEIKSFIPHPGFNIELNEYALEQYLTFQYSVLPETFFKGVYKLMPAHYFIFKDGRLKLESYWEPSFEPVQVSLKKAVEDIEMAVLNSVKKIRISNEEVGSFLSSGVDSSFIAACFKSDKTFTVGFDYNNYNEIDYVKSLSEKIGITNINKVITPKEYFQSLPKIMYHMDEPLADPAAVAFYFASQLASQHVKVALSGEGADEFFGGYNIYQEPIALQKISFLPMPFRRLLSKIVSKLPFSVKGKSFLIRAGQTVEERFIGNAKIFSKKERESILKSFTGKSPESITKILYDKVKNYDDITKMQYIDINLWMVGDILLQADKMSMAHSLEVKTPFLDKEVYNVAFKLPTKLRVTESSTKYAFRKAALKYLPESYAKRKKLGFPVPIRIWLKDDKYYNYVKKYFTNDTAVKYFHSDKLMHLLNGHKRGTADNSRKIWTVLSFLIWYEQYFTEKG